VIARPFSDRLLVMTRAEGGTFNPHPAGGGYCHTGPRDSSYVCNATCKADDGISMDNLVAGWAVAQLQALCAADQGDPVKCGECAGVHAAPLKAAGCTEAIINQWCKSIVSSGS
jgi:hypothetical protein